jgi:16S rRNA (guanine966-N2)-methyltransferase
MKILGGQFKGRKLSSPKGNAIRPTSQKIRASIFNIITHSPLDFKLVGANVLDLYCGTGAMGIEALSRGAANVIFADISVTALNVTSKNLRSIGASKQSTVIKVDGRLLSKFLSSPEYGFDIVFIDAPYGKDLTLPAVTQLGETGVLVANSVVIVEISRNEDIKIPPNFSVWDDRAYGKTRILFLGYEHNMF